MSQPLFALIDCNNFFASCEQVFRPALAGKPLVVLSSNDGCVVARSAEARALKIPMGAPAFKYRELFAQHNVLQFSANFELYGDISRRITEILTSITPRLEVYSIDESFLDISQLDIPDYEAWAKHLRQCIYDWVGVQVSIGIAPSKTLAKLASEQAKRNPVLGGALSLTDDAKRIAHLRSFPIEEIWGIGRRLAPRLRSIGVASALDIAMLNPLQGRKLIGSVHGERMVRELNGQTCYPLESLGSEQKLISASRTFGKDTDQAHEIEAALANFVAKTSQRLRVSHRTATRLAIYVTNSRFKPGYKTWSREVILDQPTADTGELIAIATKMFKELYEPGVQYHRAMALLSGFVSDTQLQTDLLGTRDVTTFDRSKQRMQAVDALHSRYGRQALYYGTEKIASQWHSRSNIRSPRYTTRWEDLPKVTKIS